MEKSVSVIIPIYRGQKYIDSLIKMISAWKNDFPEYQLEIIFVNDYPAIPLQVDNTDLEQNVVIKVLENEKNVGIHLSRITGLESAEGRYIVFLDQDDTLAPDYLRCQLECLKDNDAVICNGLYRGGEKIYSETSPIKSQYSLHEYLIDGYPLVSLGQLLIRKDCIPEEWIKNPMIYNGWDDHYLWALMMSHGVKVGTTEKILYSHEEDGSNLSFDWEQMALSGKNFRDVFLSLDILSEREIEKFKILVNNKIAKYEKYDTLEKQMTGITIEKVVAYFRNNGFFEIAIYGVGVYGKRLIEMLEETEIQVLCGIDKRKDVKSGNIPIIFPGDRMRRVDAIVVSPIFSYEEIKNNLKKYYSCAIISLSDVLDNAD